MENRVVITGVGVVSPNAINADEFSKALQEGISGVRRFDHLEALNLRCCLGAMPQLEEADIEHFSESYNLVKLRSTGILYGCMAGVEAWRRAGLKVIDKEQEEPDWDSGCIFGTSGNGLEPIEYGMHLIGRGEVRKLGGRLAQQAMNSGVSAYLGGILGLGNQVMTNSASYCTGSEAIIDAFYRIRSGYAERMLAGGAESSSKYIWAGYDGMYGYQTEFALANGFNAEPEKASCPLSKYANGIVPGAGGGAVVLEKLSSALDRGATIYAEVVGGVSNSGGQRQGGSMILGNATGIERCIRETFQRSGVSASELDLISGHLASNRGDIVEVGCWVKALERSGDAFPRINSVKSMTGHCYSAAGAIEVVAGALQLKDSYIHPSLNASELHPEIEAKIAPSCVPQSVVRDIPINTVAMLSIGMGDVNSCIILKKWNP